MKKAEDTWWITNLTRSPSIPSKVKPNPTTTSPYQFWKMAQHALRGGKKWKQRQRAFVRNSSGTQAKTIEDNVSNVCAYFSGVYNFPSRPEALPHIHRMTRRSVERSYLSPRNFEVKKAIQALKHKAPGLDGEPIMIWKALSTDPVLLNIIGNFFRQCWDTNCVPEEWLVGHMLVLPKKGDPTLAKNLRLILVEASKSKIYQWILNQRLNDFYETFSPEFSNGFRSGRGTADANFILKSVLRKRKEHDLETWVLFIDVLKAFDKIDRHRLWLILDILGVPPKMIMVLRSLYKNRTAELTMEGVTKSMNIDGGSGQGMILAPRIFPYSFMQSLICG